MDKFDRNPNNHDNGQVAKSFLTIPQAKNYVNQDMDQDIANLKTHINTLADADPFDADVSKEINRSLRLLRELQDILHKF